MPARFWIGTHTIYQGRTTDISLDLYGPDGDTPLVIASADDLLANVWQTAGAAADLEITEATLTSVITRVTNGSPGATPARVTVRFHEDDTATLDTGRYTFELYLADDSDGGVLKPLCRGEVIVDGSPT